ncbi:MAG: hypothetical protein KAI66_18880 [Lentisphaeria bacterium]|nr:hypothetical protein [Lentisphaeria bacterium]
MQSRCEQLRERTLRDGLDSTSAQVWRIHARSCEACRTELFIIESLKSQSLEDKQHIARTDYEVLLKVAEEHCAGRRKRSERANPLLIWSLRVACVCLVASIAARLMQGNPELETMGAPAGSAHVAGTVLAAPAEPPEMSDEQLYDSLQKLRSRTTWRRQAVEELIDEDTEEDGQESKYEEVPLFYVPV